MPKVCACRQCTNVLEQVALHVVPAKSKYTLQTAYTHASSAHAALCLPRITATTKPILQRVFSEYVLRVHCAD
jgi:hypothetical protein